VGLIVAVSVELAPTYMDNVVLLRVTPVTDTVEAVTVTVQVAVLLPSVVVTVIVAVPAATPVTLPLDDTVATDVSLDFQVKLLSVALDGLTVAVSASLEPATKDKVDLLSVIPVTETVAAVTVTVHVVVLLPSVVVTVIVAVPAAIPVTLPVDETVATAVLLDVQVTLWSVAVVGLIVAVNVSLEPAVKDNVDLFNATLVTETVAFVTVTIQDAVLLPSVVVTVIIAVPAAIPVTLPLDETVAIEVSLDVQVIPWFVAVVGLTVAVNVSLVPVVNDSVVLFNATLVTEILSSSSLPPLHEVAKGRIMQSRVNSFNSFI
jgi:hypothetical protein